MAQILLNRLVGEFQGGGESGDKRLSSLAYAALGHRFAPCPVRPPRRRPWRGSLRVKAARGSGSDGSKKGECFDICP